MGNFNDLEGINDCDEGIDIEKKEFVGYGYNDGRFLLINLKMTILTLNN